MSGDAVDVVARLKEESEVPMRSSGSLSMSVMRCGPPVPLIIASYQIVT